MVLHQIYQLPLNLLESMDIIMGALNNASGVDVIYLYFIKAFHRVAHSRLVLKL